MSTVAPPPAPLPLGNQAGGAAVALSVVADAKVLDALAAGKVLDAVALMRAAKGVVEAMTADGPVQLKALPGQTLPPIPEGAKLSLLVQNVGGQLRLTLTAVNGRALGQPPVPQQGTAQLPFTGAPVTNTPSQQGASATNAVPVQTHAATPAQPSQQQPAGLTATVIRPAVAPGQAATAGTPTAGLPADLPAGTQITVRIAGISPPGTPPQQPSTPGGGTAAPGHPGLASPAAKPDAAAHQTAPLGQATTAQPAAAQSLAAPRLLPAIVTAHPPGGQAVVQTPVGTLSLPTHDGLPSGTQLSLEISGEPLLPPATSGTAPRPQGLRPDGWPALADATATLKASGDRQALEALLRTLPEIGPRLAANLSIVAGALRSGEWKGLLPESSLKALEKAGRKDVAERLKADVEDLAGKAERPAGGGEWVGFTLPLLFGQVVEPISLYVRRAGGDQTDDPSKSSPGERFLLDFNLTNLGRMQMDGLVRREDKLFDLIIRTDDPLSAEMRRDIIAIFTESGELTGTKGSVAFQSGGRWLELPPDAPTPTEILI